MPPRRNKWDLWAKQDNEWILLQSNIPIGVVASIVCDNYDPNVVEYGLRVHHG